MANAGMEQARIFDELYEIAIFDADNHIIIESKILVVAFGTSTFVYK